ncbi:MAG: 50S ribosomal protein L22 [Anaerolineae bacterium]|nr:50S ribosomal protein L22 [Anaerolineae bacterium]
MDVRATSRYLPISPTKIRLVCDQVRGMSPQQAMNILQHMPHKGAGLLLKVVKSAMKNAENNFELDPGEMLISEVYANEGPRRPWRRFGARGRFKPWIRRTSHVTVVLSEQQVIGSTEKGEK